MSATVLSGKVIAAEVLDEVEARSARLAHHGIHPCLVFVLIGESEPAAMYAHRLQKLGKPRGISVVLHEMPATITHQDLRCEIAALNADAAVDGILVQMPLPDHLNISDLSPVIDPNKDVDGITVGNGGRLYLGLPGQAPSTALAMMQILDWSGHNPTGKHAVVVGRSNVVGHPVTELLLHRDATVTVTHRQTDDLGQYTRQADILLVAAGEPHLIGEHMIKPGVVVVDAGINVTPDGVMGDVDFEACRERASAITPVPGGVGPVTNAVLLRNVVHSAEHRAA
jgi:methylenetetrahydrofolate dehydrogenase (NADP+)/methenyltetrahydrofolate cyclohydrolase